MSFWWGQQIVAVWKLFRDTKSQNNDVKKMFKVKVILNTINSGFVRGYQRET